MRGCGNSSCKYCCVPLVTTLALPKVNIRCQTTSDGITGTTYLNVIAVEQEDDGSITAVTDHWPNEKAK